MIAKPSLIAAGLALGFATLVPGKAEAHRRWLLPSMTVLSGESETVTVDAAASNELFVFEHRPMSLENLTIVGPDGQPVQAAVIGTGKYRSVFDVPLAQQGTYRIAVATNGAMGSYVLNGETRRFRGNAGQIPEGATDVRIVRSASRTETFVTLGAPNDAALQPTGEGLEMIPVSHPNDLYAGEPAQVRFLLDGQPAAGLEIEFIKGGTRFRNEAGIETLTTDAEGVATLSAGEPGVYYIETASGGGDEDGPGGGTPPAPPSGEPERRASYTAVLEFLPL